MITLVADTGSAATAHIDATADAPGESYTYRLKAIRNGKRSQASEEAAMQLPGPPPAAPSGLTAQYGNGGIVLVWNAPAEDAASVTGYEVLRAQGKDELTTLVADTGNAATAYTDASVNGFSESYAYRVRAVRDGERSPDSNEARLQLPPARPTGVGSAVSSDTVMLIWADPQDDSITGYRILRRDGDAPAGGEFTTIESDTGSAATTYTDDTVEAGPGCTCTGCWPSAPMESASLPATLRSAPPRRRNRCSASPPRSPGFSIMSPSRPGGLSLPTTRPPALRPGAPRSRATSTTRRMSTGSGSTRRRGLLYQIDLGPEPVMDPAADPELVGIYDASGNLLPRTSNDNVSVSNLDSRVFFSSSEDGAYYVAVGSADSGAYRLSVSLISFPRTDSVSEEMGEDFPETEDTKGFILVGGTVTGNIDGIDIDWFQTQLEAGHRYQIDVEGVDTSQGTLTDPVLYTVRGYLVGAPVATVDIANTSDDDSGSGKNARSTFTMPDSYFEAPVYISVTSEENATGTYRMRLREVVPLGGDGEPIEARLEPGDSVSGTFDPFTWYYFALDGLTSGRYTVSFSKGGHRGYLCPWQLDHGPAPWRGEVHLRRPLHRHSTDPLRLARCPGRRRQLHRVPGRDHARPGGRRTAGGRRDSKTTNLIVAPGGPWGTSMQFFPVELEAGVVYQVDIKGVDTGDGTMDYPMLANIAAPDGSYVGGTNHLFVQRGGEGRNVRYVFTADQDGMYFLKAGGALWKITHIEDGVTGSYTRYRAGTFTVSIQETGGAPSCTLNRGDLWCGVVTVGSGGGIDGYAREEVGDIGDLSDTDVDVGPNSYTIIGIFVQ